MSGVVKGIGKVFKAVGKVVKKLLPIALIAGAAIFAAPAVAGLLGVGAAATGAAGAVGAGGAVAGTAAASGGIGGFLSGIMGTGASGGGLGSLLSSSTAGSLLSGAASGFMQGEMMEDREKALIATERRRGARYEGAGDAASFDFTGAPDPAGALPGLGIRKSSMIDPTALVQNVAFTRPQRPSVVEAAAAPQKKPRYRYNATTGRIDYA